MIQPRRLGGGLALLAALALIMGLQLGSISWRFRLQWLQLQAGLGGAVVGFVAGRLSAARRGP
jgi:hypothetical protein